MKFKIIVDVRPNPDNNDLLDVTISRQGRVARKDGAVCAAIQFSVTQAVQDTMLRMGAKNGANNKN